MPPFVPTDAMASEARRGIAWKKEHGRGGTRVRARQIANKSNLSLSVVKRMHSFFSRHEKASKGAEGFRRGEKGYPSNGRIAWALWGGDAGQKWAKRIRDKEAKKMSEGKNRLTFEASIQNVDRESGVLRDIVIIEAGEAKGHRMMVTNRSIATASSILSDEIIPAYITHRDAFKDRLLNEIGAFEGFYRDGEKIRAQKFEAFNSWKEDEPEKYDRLFDLAEKMPNSFGISIVFEGNLLWETEEGDEEFNGFSSKPENAFYDLPTIIPTEISSADFVDSPAATNSLFSENWDKPTYNMKEKDMELSESASAEKERREAEENQQQAKPEVAEEKPAKKVKKSKEFSEEAVLEPEVETEEAVVEEVKAVAEEVETEEPVAEEVDSEEIEEEEEEDSEEEEEKPSEEEVSLSEKMNIQFELIEGQEKKIAELERTISALKSIFGGEEPIGEGDNAAPISKSELKKQLIEKHLSENPENDRFTAHIEVAKENKELFGLKQ